MAAISCGAGAGSSIAGGSGIERILSVDITELIDRIGRCLMNVRRESLSLEETDAAVKSFSIERRSLKAALWTSVLDIEEKEGEYACGAGVRETYGEAIHRAIDSVDTLLAQVQVYVVVEKIKSSFTKLNEAKLRFDAIRAAGEVSSTHTEEFAVAAVATFQESLRCLLSVCEAIRGGELTLSVRDSIKLQAFKEALIVLEGELAARGVLRAAKELHLMPNFFNNREIYEFYQALRDVQQAEEALSAHMRKTDLISSTGEPLPCGRAVDTALLREKTLAFDDLPYCAALREESLVLLQKKLREAIEMLDDTKKRLPVPVQDLLLRATDPSTPSVFLRNKEALMAMLSCNPHLYPKPSTALGPMKLRF